MIRNLAILSASALVLAACVSNEPRYSSSGSQDAKVAGTDYHATSIIPCAIGVGAPTGSCNAGVKREGNGSGMVTVAKPDGRTRTIFFNDGRATGYDQSQADTGRFTSSKQGDMSVVHIGNERYQIPDAVIYGG